MTTASSPTSKRSAVTGTLPERMTALRPILAPSSRRYALKIGVPAKALAGAERTMSLAAQNRK